MPVTVRVQHFQSIDDATVVVDGFTVVTGPNNSGKTSLMRAIRGVFLNSPAGPLVRRGSAQLTVTIDFGDGKTVKWEKGWEKPGQKGKTVNKYTVNGVELEDVGRGCPPEVLALGMSPIKAGARDVWPQIADQFTGVLFLVGAPGSATAEAIANVDRVGKLSAALKLSEKERRQVTSRLKIRRGDEEKLVEEAEAFEGLDDVAGQVVALEAATKTAEDYFTELVVAATLRKRRRAAVAGVESYAGIGEVVVPSLEAVRAARNTRTTLTDMRRIRQRVDAYGLEVESYAGIGEVDVPGTGAVKEARALRDDLSTHRDLSTRLVATKSTLSKLDSYDDVKLPDTVKVLKIQGVVTFFKGLAQRRTAALAEINRITDMMAIADTEYLAAETAVATLLGELGECPTCGTVTADGKHIHREVA